MRTLLFTESPMLVYILFYITINVYYKYNNYIVLFIAASLLLLFVYFYRFPLRYEQFKLKPSNENNIIAPSDGTVQEITKDTKGNIIIKVFLAVSDVHVQWCPVAGEVVSIQYIPGTFMPAKFLQKSKYNERNVVLFKTKKNQFVEVKQIAGIIATRISCWINPSQLIKQGEPYGMIKLSSRVDITIPASSKVLVKTGETIYGCQTILATFA